MRNSLVKFENKYDLSSTMVELSHIKKKLDEEKAKIMIKKKA